MKRACDSCGVEVADSEISVYALPGIPMSVGNCAFCTEMNLYPYGTVVANTASIGGIEHAVSWWKEIVRDTLIRDRKRIAEFDADVKEAMADMGIARLPESGDPEG